MYLPRSGERVPRASSLRASRIVYEYFNWERVVDHVDPAVLIVLVRLDGAARVLGAGQQRVLPGLFRCKPIEFPTSPRMPSHRIQEFCAGPWSAGNRIDPVRGKGFVNTWSRDFGLEIHFSQCAPHGLSIHRSPVGIIRCLPVTVKRLTYGPDTRQPFDGSHSIVSRHNCADRKSVIPRKITPIHLIGDQDFP